jgi:choline dehydrogenase
MGRSDDDDAVVDSQFRVRKVKGLRVVDASIFSEIPGYFLVTSIYMAAEKASNDILQGTEPPAHA